MTVATLIRIALAIIFIAVGTAIFLGYESVLRELEAAGLGKNHIYFIGLCNIAAGWMILFPTKNSIINIIGSIIILATAGEAVFIHVTMMKKDIIGPSVIFALSLFNAINSLRIHLSKIRKIFKLYNRYIRLI